MLYAFKNHSLKSGSALLIAISLLAVRPSLAWIDPELLVQEGDRYLALQQLEEAEKSYRDALKLAKKQHSSPDVRATCLVKLAATLQLEDETEQVIPLYKKAIKVLARKYGRESVEVIPPISALGNVSEDETHYQLAGNYYQRAFSIDEKQRGPNHINTACDLHDLARAQAAQQLFQPAEENYFRALTIMMQQKSLPSSRDLETLLADYIALVKKLDTPTKNLISEFNSKLLQDKVASNTYMGMPQSNWQKQVSAILAKQSQSAGVNPPPTPATPPPALVEQPASLDVHGKNYYERMVAIDTKALGPNHPTVADDLSALASIYFAQHQYEGAKPLLNRALTIYENAYGKDSLLVTKTIALLAFIERGLSPNDLERMVYTDPSKLADIPTEAIRPEISRRLNELAFTRYCQGKFDEANTLYHWALASTKGATGNHSMLTAACLADFAKLLKSQGNSAEAQKMQDTASAILAESAFSQRARIN